MPRLTIIPEYLVRGNQLMYVPRIDITCLCHAPTAAKKVWLIYVYINYNACAYRY